AGAAAPEDDGAAEDHRRLARLAARATGAPAAAPSIAVGGGEPVRCGFALERLVGPGAPAPALAALCARAAALIEPAGPPRPGRIPLEGGPAAPAAPAALAAGGAAASAAPTA